MRIPYFRSTILLLAVLGACRDPEQTAFPGTIELDESDAAPLVPGRVVEVRVDEGDSVVAGDTLALLTQSTIPAAVAERRARLAVARARLADLERGSRSGELERARADLDAAEAEVTRSGRDLERIEPLARDGVVPAQDLDRVKAAATTALRRRDAAKATLQLAEEGSRRDQIQAARAEVQSAEAQLSGANADLGELAVLAAVSGVVLARHVDPGEVIAAGTPVVTVGEVASRWVRVYLPARLLSTLREGSAADVQVAGTSDSSGTTAGTLGAVRARAEYTPRSALTEEERADLLFASRIELKNPPVTLRPGLPVTVRFAAGGEP
jgi:HlyD family secretion protein